MDLRSAFCRRRPWYRSCERDEAGENRSLPAAVIPAAPSGCRAGSSLHVELDPLREREVV
jgi:hypothetical protein